MVVDIVRDPAELGKSKEFTFVQAGTPAAVARLVCPAAVSAGGAISLRFFRAENCLLGRRECRPADFWGRLRTRHRSLEGRLTCQI